MQGSEWDKVKRDTFMHAKISCTNTDATARNLTSLQHTNDREPGLQSVECCSDIMRASELLQSESMGYIKVLPSDDPIISGVSREPARWTTILLQRRVHKSHVRAQPHSLWRVKTGQDLSRIRLPSLPCSDLLHSIKLILHCASRYRDFTRRRWWMNG